MYKRNDIISFLILNHSLISKFMNFCFAHFVHNYVYTYVLVLTYTSDLPDMHAQGLRVAGLRDKGTVATYKASYILS